MGGTKGRWIAASAALVVAGCSDEAALPPGPTTLPEVVTTLDTTVAPTSPSIPEATTSTTSIVTTTSATPVPTTGPPAPEPASSGVVLEIVDDRNGGGFAGPAISRFPPVTLFADGRLFARDRRSTGRLIASGHQERLDRAALRQVVGEAVAAGVTDPPPDVGRPAIADASATIFRLRTTTSEVTLVVPDLGYSEESRPPRERAVRRRLLDLVASVDARAARGPVYAPPAVGVRGVDPSAPYWRSSSPSGPVRDWPAPSRPLVPSGCVVLTGSDLAAALPVLRDADPTTRWKSGDAALRVLTSVTFPEADPCS